MLPNRAEIGSLSLSELNRLELQFLLHINFDLSLPPADISRLTKGLLDFQVRAPAAGSALAGRRSSIPDASPPAARRCPALAMGTADPCGHTEQAAAGAPARMRRSRRHSATSAASSGPPPRLGPPTWTDSERAAGAPCRRRTAMAGAPRDAEGVAGLR